MADQYMRVNQFLTTLTVGDYSGTWQQKEGGDKTSEATTTKPGGMAPAVAVPGGSPTKEAITLTNQMTFAHAMGVYHQLEAYVGTGEPATVSQQPLGYDKLPFGKPLVSTGVIQSITEPSSDANSEDLASFQVVIAPNGI